MDRVIEMIQAGLYVDIADIEVENLPEVKEYQLQYAWRIR